MGCINLVLESKQRVLVGFEIEVLWEMPKDGEFPVLMLGRFEDIEL